MKELLVNKEVGDEVANVSLPQEAGMLDTPD
jgi:hypothetical protein